MWRRRADIKGPGQPLGRALILTLIECFRTRVTDSSRTHTLPPSQPRQSVPCGSSASVIRYHYHLVSDTSSYAGEHQKMDRNNFLPRQTVGFPFKLNLHKGSSAFSLHHGAFQIAISFCFSSTKEPSLFLSGHLRSTEKSNHGQIPQNSWA